MKTWYLSFHYRVQKFQLHCAKSSSCLSDFHLKKFHYTISFILKFTTLLSSIKLYYWNKAKYSVITCLFLSGFRSTYYLNLLYFDLKHCYKMKSSFPKKVHYHNTLSICITLFLLTSFLRETFGGRLESDEKWMSQYGLCLNKKNYTLFNCPEQEFLKQSNMKI